VTERGTDVKRKVTVTAMLFSAVIRGLDPRIHADHVPARTEPMRDGRKKRAIAERAADGFGPAQRGMARLVRCALDQVGETRRAFKQRRNAAMRSGNVYHVPVIRCFKQLEKIIPIKASEL